MINILSKYKNHFKFFSCLFIYLVTNLLFIIKYSVRQNYVSEAVVLALFTLFTLGIVLARKTLLFKNLNHKKTSFYYWFIVLCAAVTFSILITKIDGNTLNTDRWSALELTIETITQGKYPYTRLDHKEQMSSNFPALGFLGLPFYVLGDVGYLQVFILVIFAYFLCKTSNQIQTALLGILLFLFSPAILWEFLGKSDLTSNLMLFVIIAHFWFQKDKNPLLNKPILTGVFMAFFLLTRGVLIIPVVIYFFKDFVQSLLKTKLTLIASAVIFGFIICLPTILTIPDWETFITYNPLVLQTNKAHFLTYLFLVATPFLSFLAKDENDRLFFSGLIMFLIPFVSMLVCIVNEGWQSTIFKSYYDITYLTMALPFVILYIISILNVEKG